jgi:hypothetical protein
MSRHSLKLHERMIRAGNIARPTGARPHLCRDLDDCALLGLGTGVTRAPKELAVVMYRRGATASHLTDIKIAREA